MNRGLLLLAGTLALGGCRGQVSEDPPLHGIPDMDWQPKYLPQSESAFFSDHRSMRDLVPGTVARGTVIDDETYETGKSGDSFVNKIPTSVVVDDKLVRRGEQRFNIYCAPCHDRTGSGDGLVAQHGYPKPVSLYGADALSLADGQVFDIITNGIRNMPGYGHMVPIADRWAIVSWVRVLQRSQNATLADVPNEQKNSMKQGSPL